MTRNLERMQLLGRELHTLVRSAALVVAVILVMSGCSAPLDANESRHRLLTHCGLGFPMRYQGRNWLPVDPELRETFNAPKGFSSDNYFDEGVVREVDDDTLIYISSDGEEVEYEPTNKQRGGCD